MRQSLTTPGKTLLRHLGTLAALAGLGLAASKVSSAAETSGGSKVTQTIIALKLGTNEALSVRSHATQDPPVIVIEFPDQKVIGALPERSVVDSGVVQQILTRYQDFSGVDTRRYIRSLHIALKAPYPWRVWAENGNVMVEIEHPTTVSSASLEVGLRGGTVIRSLPQPAVYAKFRAMQSALEEAAIGETPLQMREQDIPRPIKPLNPTASSQSSAPIPTLSAAPKRSYAKLPLPFVFGMLSAAGLMLLSLGVLTWLSWQMSRREPEPVSAGLRQEAASSTLLIDELIWRAFERQGYQLMRLQEIPQSASNFRIIKKDSRALGLWAVGNGLFFEKQTVERFGELLESAQLEEGILAATGSFTVPAQRLAKERHITLVGREQLVELLGMGAASAYVQSQLQQAQSQLDEAKTSIRRYETELETLRRQRNEASWHLGSERVKSASMEAQVAQLSAQLDSYREQVAHWEEEAKKLKKQWQESEWFLGESRDRERYFSEQLAQLQQAATTVESLTKARDDAHWFLGEEKTKREALEAELVGLRLAKTEAERCEAQLRETAETLCRQLEAISFYGERRAAVRAHVPDAFIEIRNGQEEPVFSGVPADISSTGMRLHTQNHLPFGSDDRIVLHLPGMAEAAQVQAERVWEKDEASDGQSSGYRFVDISEGARAHLNNLAGRASA